MCTNLMLRTDTPGHPVISARTLDFGQKIPTYATIMPRGQSFPRIAAPGALSWRSTYGYAGMALEIAGLPAASYIDGLNEAGLSAAALWLPGSSYPTPDQAGGRPTIYSIELVEWILGCFGTVDEVKEALAQVTVLDIRRVAPGYSKPPLHYIVSDAAGRSLIVEFMGQSMQLYTCGNGVLTNAPSYDWQLINLSNYENISLVNSPRIWWGQELNGSGQLGLPGDPTPPSRFVRATALQQSGYGPSNEQHGVGLANQLIRSLAVPYGTILPAAPGGDGDHTQWAVIRDHRRRDYYFWSAFNPTLFKISLASLDLSAISPKRTPVDQPNWHVDL
ncbi:linear amide C-N hydrolase [Paenibacillus methanolicus]|uniref:Choloylglycine hydrolase n=1 Tax=Paenibacillus methanolicus TaxID=582686 RepID=A0A5S5C817_9BACL|nr:linear amide C-N hydrolase [Paenibacillus methanolicus]TYP74133.1 choloylglycine hydrolase [Paenibacillus methanolicus]